jgi:hypothetical protein
MSCWVLEYSVLPCEIFVQVTSLMTLLCLCRGPTLYLMVGPWSGICPRPTPIPPSDIMSGLAWYLIWWHVQCPCFKLRCKTWNFKRFCNNFHQLVTDATFKILMYCIRLWCKNVMAFVSLDSPSCEVPCLILHSVVYQDIIRQAKGLYRLKHVEPSRVDSCHTRFRKGNRMHPICAPGSSSAHIVDVTSEYPNNALMNKSIIILYYMTDSLNLKRINKRR